MQIAEDFVSSDLETQVFYLRSSAQNQLSDTVIEKDWQSELNTEPLIENQALWLKIKLLHNAFQQQNFVLSLSNPALDDVTLYMLDRKGRILRSFKNGVGDLIQQQRVTQIAFSLAARQKVTLVMRVVDDGPMAIDLKLWRADVFDNHERNSMLLIGAVTGALVILACFFLVTYILLRSNVRYWFALACLSFALLYLSMHGILGAYTGLQAFNEPINTLLTALALFSAGKFSFAILNNVPGYWRMMCYLLVLLTAVSAFAFNAYWQLIISLALAGAALALLMFLAWLYDHHEHTQITHLYAGGWLTLGVAAFAQASLYLLTGAVVLDWLFTLIMLAGVLLLTVAIEFHQQTHVKLQYQQLHSDQQQQE